MGSVVSLIFALPLLPIYLPKLIKTLVEYFNSSDFTDIITGTDWSELLNQVFINFETGLPELIEQLSEYFSSVL